MNKQNAELPGTAPFTPEQVQWLNGFLASLQGEQLAWLEGYLGGLRASGTPSGTAEAAPAPPLTILYGSESGNAENLADSLAKTAKTSGFKPRTLNMGDVNPAKLKGAENLLVLVSTWGEGDPPESATAFYEAFMSGKAPKLGGTRFSVLALGDTSYEHFCKMGKDFDRRLEELGGERIFPRKDCDVDFDDDFATWQSGVLEALGAATKASAPVVQTPAPTVTPVKYTRKNPLASELTERVLLNGSGSAKETIHLEFSLEGSGLTYEVGDALAVVPHNADDVVEDLIRSSKLDAEAPVGLKEGEFSFRQALTSHLDITTLSLPVMKRYAEMAKSNDLDTLLDPANKEKLQAYLYGREIVDLLHDFPPAEINEDAFASIMRKLPPRLYSIASSLKAHPEEVHLTVGVVRYDSNGRKRKGVCSTYLAERLKTGDKAEVFVSPNKNFKLPADPETPVIMIGPGTGIAPFRAFVEERKAIGAAGKNWLFFGDQHYLTDFLYQLEWQDYEKDGILNRLDLAFSRDQAHKIYVQDRMLERGKDLYAWLEEGASFYVCGDATRMAVDVDKALHTIIAREGGKGEEAAADYVKQLKADKRYLRDVY